MQQSIYKRPVLTKGLAFDFTSNGNLRLDRTQMDMYLWANLLAEFRGSAHRAGQFRQKKVLQWILTKT